MPFWMRRVLLAPVGEEPAAGDGEGSAPPAEDVDPNPPAADDGAPDDGAPDDGGAGTDDGTSPARRAEAPRAGQQDNAIPHARVRQMLAAERARVQRELRAEIGPILQQLDPKRLRQELSVEMLRALGQEPAPPKPKYLTQEDVDRLLKERDDRYTVDRQRDEHERRIERETAIAEQEMADLRRANADVFEHFPELEDDIANAWGSRTAVEQRLTVKAIGEKRIKALKASIGKFNKAFSEGAEERQQVTPVQPQGAAGARTEKKGPDLSSSESVKKAVVSMLKRKQAAG